MTQAVVGAAASVEKKVEEEAVKLYKQFLKAKEAIEASAPYDLAHTILLRAGYSCPTKKQVMALRQHLLDGIHHTKVIRCSSKSGRYGASLYQPK